MDGRFCVSLQTVLCCCQFTASYIFSCITCFAWTGDSGTIVPPYLRGQLGGTSPHRRGLIQAVNATHCWLFSHTGRYLGCYCVWFFWKTGVFAIWAENNVHFLLGMEMVTSLHITMWLSKTIPQLIMQIKERVQTAAAFFQSLKGLENILLFSPSKMRKICILKWILKVKQGKKKWRFCYKDKTETVSNITITHFIREVSLQIASYMCAVCLKKWFKHNLIRLWLLRWRPWSKTVNESTKQTRPHHFIAIVNT